MTIKRRGPAMVLSVLAVAAFVALAGCGSSSSSTSSSSSGSKTTASKSNVKGDISVVGIWVAQEQKNFQRVIAAFNKQYPNVHVKYNPAGDNTPTVLATALSGGRPPDIASVGQPGLVKQFEQQGKLKPLDFARTDIENNFSPDIVKLGENGGEGFNLLPQRGQKNN